MKATIVIFLLISMQTVLANDPSPLGAHTHGEGQITLIYHEGRLQIELQSPAANMLGFEHRPTTEQQWQALEQLSLTLNQPQRLVTLPPACKVTNVTVELPYERSVSDEKHDDHHHAPSDTSHSYNTHHRDIHTRYTWLCSTPLMPTIRFNHFEIYAGFDKISVEWIVNGAQGITHLHKNKSSLEFAQ